MTETSPFRGPGRRRDVQSLRTQGRFSTREAPAASRCGGRPETSDRTHHTEHVAHAKQPRREREGHGSDHHQQRKMGDELELLGRMVQGCGTVGGTGEGVRVDDDEAIDMVGMREERDGAPIPGKEYQQQRSACFPAVSLHPVQSGDAAKIGKSSGISVQQVHLRKQGDRTSVRSPSRINPPHIGSMSSSERHCTGPIPTSYSTARRTRPKQDECRSRTTEDSRRRRPESAPPTTPR